MRFISFLIIKWYGFLGHLLDFGTEPEYGFRLAALVPGDGDKKTRKLQIYS
jgi:hypothetical protein